MAKYVIGPDVALALAEREASIPPQHRVAGAHAAAVVDLDTLLG